MKILAIVPAYNEEDNIADVIRYLKAVDFNLDIVVVNDGSSDLTGSVAESTKSVYVVNLPCNIGIGGAVQTGFKFARLHNYDIAIQFDGDGQHLSSEIEKIVAPVLSSTADVVIGSRFVKKHKGFRSTFSRRIGIKLFSLINTVLIRQKITDNTSGFRAYNKKAIKFLSVNYPVDYPEPEAIILLGKNGFRLREVFVQMQERNNGKSSIYGFRSFYYMVKVILSIFMSASRPKIILRDDVH